MVQLFYATYMYIGEDSAYYEIFLAKVGIQHIIRGTFFMFVER